MAEGNGYFWRDRLSRALKRNRRDAHSRYFQLATVDGGGRPRNRTVVFRGFAPDSDALLVITDARSLKIDDLAHQPAAEVCWYFTGSREQFRLVVHGQILSASTGHIERRRAVWSQLSDTARAQFFWATPGLPLDEVPAEQRSGADIVASGADMAEPPDTFVVLQLNPSRVDHLILNKQQQRFLSSASDADGWLVQEIQP